MATSGMSYAVHYDLNLGQDSILQDFSRMRIETVREPPVLYVAMATWIPKCNMYHNNTEPQSPEVVDEIDLTEENVVEEKVEEEKSEKVTKQTEETVEEKIEEKSEKITKQIEDKLTITPKKALSPRQVQKKLESEKKRQQKQMEREEREKKKQEEKEKIRLEKEQMKKEKEELKNKKEEQKRKERELKEEQKRKEREEKEAKRKEKEEREEAKRKEREQEKQRKQQELEEKNREKLKLEEQKLKAAQAFVNFFVAKKTETKGEDIKTMMFMPFEVKSDMKLAPRRRSDLTQEEKDNLIDGINKGEGSYLKELETGRKCPRTWPSEDDDVIIIEEDIGESICEDKQKLKKMRVKFLKFHDNRRPPYYGTWRKKSFVIKARKPVVLDKKNFDYEVDSDDDWEEEEQGESLNGSDDEEKENETQDDYEVDNEFFVPHGHLSDDEVDDEEMAKLSPESLKEKLKLLKDEFDEDMQTKTNRMKPRSIGCIWYLKDRSNVDEAIDKHLRPLTMITNGQIILKKRKNTVASTPSRKYGKELPQDLIPAFLKVINGNVNKKATVVEEFINYMSTNGHVVDVSKAYLKKCVKQYAQWRKCNDVGPRFNKYCWCVEDEIKKKYNLE